jgi:hypothetical protein
MRILAHFGFLIGAGEMVVYPRRRIKMGGKHVIPGHAQRQPGIPRHNLWIPGLRFAHPGMTEPFIEPVRAPQAARDQVARMSSYQYGQ